MRDIQWPDEAGTRTDDGPCFQVVQVVLIEADKDQAAVDEVVRNVGSVLFLLRGDEVLARLGGHLYRSLVAIA